MHTDENPGQSASPSIAAEASHNKDEYPPMHTAEHLLNATMVAMFGCPRSVNAHIEKKKSKCDYELPRAPTDTEVAEIERRVNEAIARALPVSVEFVGREDAARVADLRKLPAEAGERIRIVRIGDYDACACVGAHVSNTSEIAGKFRIASSEWNAPTWRARFRLES